MNDHDDLQRLEQQADQFLRTLSRAERLETLPRTGWIICGIQNPESIASHTCMVAITALWIADHLDEPVNTELLLRMALLHDLGEAMLTDLPWPVKRFVGAQVLKDAEARAADLILEHAPPSWPQAYAQSAQTLTIEGRILKAADRIQMLAKALQYHTQQRGDVSRFWQHPEHTEDFGIPLVRAIFDRLRDHYEQGSWYPSDLD